tara:strand:+ start:10273 stop:10638 length:366 start_codon:yes stop_codon:yes gene_type:complete
MLIMSKDIIKKLVRSSLLKEEEKTRTSVEDKEKDSSKDGREENKNSLRDYSDVKNSLDKDKNPTAPSHVGIMKSMGIENDEGGIARSLFGKKLRQEKNSEGGVYQFDDDDLAKIRAIITGV